VEAVSNLFEIYSPANIIQIAVRNMAFRNWSLELDKANFSIYLGKDNQLEMDFMVLGAHSGFTTSAFVQNELTSEIYYLRIELSPLQASHYSVLNVKRISSKQFDEQDKKSKGKSRIEGGNPFIKTEEYLRRQELTKPNDEESSN
jgi:hypothetical protein